MSTRRIYIFRHNCIGGVTVRVLTSSVVDLGFIGGVTVRVLTSTVVDRGFEPRSDQIKDNTIGIYCFSAKHAVLRRKTKTGWVGIGIKYPIGATCLSTDF